MDQDSFNRGLYQQPASHDDDEWSRQQGENTRQWNQRLLDEQAAAEKAQRDAADQRQQEWQQYPAPSYPSPGGGGQEAPTPDPERLTAFELLVAAPIGVGLIACVAALLFGWPYLEVALLAASATLVIGLVARLKALLLGLALIYGVLYLAGVDGGFVVDPASRLAHDLARAVDGLL
jgi:hypothetical protein